MQRAVQRSKIRATNKTRLTISTHTGTGLSSTDFVRFFIVTFTLQHSHNNSLADSLLAQFEKYQNEWQESSESFAKLSSLFSGETLRLWEEMEGKPFRGRDGKPQSVFQVNSTQRKCTFVPIDVAPHPLCKQQVPSQRTQTKHPTDVHPKISYASISRDDCDLFVAILEEAIEIQRLQYVMHSNQPFNI